VSLARFPIAAEAIAANPITTPAPAPGVPAFDVLATVISQYANSPVLLAVVLKFAEWLDAGRLFDDFFRKVWDLDTAEGWGLDVLGRIVGASRIINIPAGGTFIGFEGQTTAQNWGHGVWYKGASATNNVALADPIFRRVIEAKARANICDGSSQSINRILMALFPGYGNCYVKDNGDMTMEYHFGAPLSPVDYAIASQEGLLPKPTGVAVSIVVDV